MSNFNFSIVEFEDTLKTSCCLAYSLWKKHYTEKNYLEKGEFSILVKGDSVLFDAGLIPQPSVVVDYFFGGLTFSGNLKVRS